MIRSMLLLTAMGTAWAQTGGYSGLVPEKADLPYLKHANNLVATQPVKFQEQKTANDTVYTTPGERSPAKTPLALPIFMIKAAKLNPEHLQMYRLEIKDGHRDMTAAGRQKQDVIHVRVVSLGSGLYRMEVADDLESGQYVLSLDGGDEGFCFEID